MDFEEFISEWKSTGESISVKTSGSTGAPKIISLSKQFVSESARRTIEFFKLDSASHLHSCVGADYIGGKMMAVRSLISGCRFTWETPSNRPLSSLKPTDHISLLAVVPSQMLHLVQRLDELPKIDNIIIGGSPIDNRLRSKIINTGLNAFETYGMTETASHIAIRRIDEEWFHTMKGINVNLDSRGCLVIVMPDNTEIVTNDIAKLKNNKEFKIKGRADHIIITGGKKINPIDVENKISTLVNGPFFISSLPDEKWGEKIVLCLEGDSGKENTDDILLKMKEVLLPFEMPKEIKFYKELPKTANGKIKRR